MLKTQNKYLKHAGLLLKRAKNNLFNTSNFQNGQPVSLSPETIAEYNKNRYYGNQKYVCLAPFNSMFLSINGNVYACNLNRKFVLGNIKTMSLSEIWNGQKTKNLREHIANADLNHGCEKCLLNIKNKNFDASTSSHYDYVGYDANTQFPLRIDFEISNICNLGCVMCCSTFSSTIQKEIKNEKLTKTHYNKNILEDLRQFIPHLKFMNFSGGEPFMNNLYFDIWEMTAELNKDCQVHIQTNGTIMNEKVEDILNKHRFNIGISIDSLQKVTYDNIRLFSDFDKRQSILQQLTNYCHKNKTTLTYSFCLLKKNAMEIPEFLAYANLNNAVLYLSPVFEPYEEAIWNLPIEELESLKQHYLSYKTESKNDIQTKNNIHYKQFILQLDVWINRQKTKNDFLSKNDFNSEEIIQHTKEKLKKYFDNYTEINGQISEDELECFNYLDKVFIEKNIEKMDALRNMILENEERIYNQVKYYWI
ncbi:MAG: SPASM domain-containing protein [Chitinophagaceae bacterium]|nr:SPASM domain-containing protein [Chitinophagaceae bacterium]